MKKILFLISLFPLMSFAQTGYDIVINDSGYNLKITMDFKEGQTLQDVRSALKNGVILSQLSPNVVSVTNTPVEDNKYKSLMVVKSFFIKSNLLSMCEDSEKENTWKRSCSLQTHQMDGGKYMEWKADDVECTKILNGVHCDFLIKGLARPLKIFGVQIVNARVFSAKAKSQALNNFFKQYYFIKNHNLTAKIALAQFDQSKVKTEIEEFESTATQKLKKGTEYKRHYTLEN